MSRVTPSVLSRVAVALIAGLFLLALPACDSASDDPVDVLDDAAVSIASAIALETGGVLNDAAVAGTSGSADLTDAGAEARSAASPCTFAADFIASEVAWMRTVSCAYTGTYGSASYSRTQKLQYFNASGRAVASASNADSLSAAMLAASGSRVGPYVVHHLLSLDGSHQVSGLHAATATVTGTNHRTATDTLTTRNVERALAYDLAVTYDLEGPTAAYDGWASATSGTIDGTYTATIRVTNGTGDYDERSVDVDFHITFANGRGTLTINDRTFTFDPETGEVDGIAS